MNIAYRTGRFRLGHVLGIFLGRELRFAGESFPIEPIVTFMFGVRVPSEDFPSAVTECRNELLRQFPSFTAREFVFEMARLSTAIGYLPEGADVMPVIAAWCGEQVSRFGDTFDVRPVRSAFLFLDDGEKKRLARHTAGQDGNLN